MGSMPGIKVRDNEGFDSAVRRFKRVVEKSGILSEMRRREFHETPSMKRKRATAAAVKRFRKKVMRDTKMSKEQLVRGRRLHAQADDSKGAEESTDSKN